MLRANNSLVVTDPLAYWHGTGFIV
jgi:hypothetical protein